MRDYSKAVTHLNDHEGNVRHMYLDTAKDRKVTVGVGHLLAKPADVVTLPFYNRKTNTAATPEEKLAAFQAVQAAKDKKTAKAFAEVTDLELKQDYVNTQLRAHITEFENRLRKHFPDYDSYPDEAQLALVDMAFNLGVAGLLKFTNLVAAVRARDWAVAAQECHRKGVGERRNVATRKLFETAAAQEYGPPAPIRR